MTESGKHFSFEQLVRLVREAVEARDGPERTEQYAKQNLELFRERLAAVGAEKSSEADETPGIASEDHVQLPNRQPKSDASVGTGSAIALQPHDASQPTPDPEQSEAVASTRQSIGVALADCQWEGVPRVASQSAVLDLEWTAAHRLEVGFGGFVIEGENIEIDASWISSQGAGAESGIVRARAVVNSSFERAILASDDHGPPCAGDQLIVRRTWRESDASITVATITIELLP